MQLRLVRNLRRGDRIVLPVGGNGGGAPRAMLLAEITSCDTGDLQGTYGVQFKMLNGVGVAVWPGDDYMELA